MKEAAKTESTTKRQPMRSIHRPAGVNFKVELHDSPSTRSLPKMGGNLKTIQKHLQRLGVRYDLMKEYLNVQKQQPTGTTQGEN